MDIAALIVSIAKAVPAIDRIYQRSVTLYFARQEKKDQEQMNEVQQKRDALVSSMKQPGLTDEERRTLRRMLIELHKL